MSHSLTPDCAPATSAAGELAKTSARRLADATPLKLYVAYARAFCAAVIARYWTNLLSGTTGMRLPRLLKAMLNRD